MSQPIDYARADADVVRKKFRRRVVMFVIATVVGLLVGVGWVHSSQGNQMKWLFGGPQYKPPFTIYSESGWIMVCGPIRASVNVKAPQDAGFWNNTIGFRVQKLNIENAVKWAAGLRYRTLFLLAMIPWIITLIRMIRMWKRKRVFETEPRTQ